MRLTRLLACASCLLALAVTDASADVTFFLGTASAPTTRAMRGAAIGVNFLVVGAEFEYTSTVEDAASGSPALKTAMVSGHVMPPFAIARMQPYLAVGGGGYRERIGSRQETNVAISTGGGVKVSLLGPLRARFDYRLMKLRGAPVQDRLHRFYAGLNVSF